MMRTVPLFLRGAFSGALRLVLQQIISGGAAHNPVLTSRAWKLFMLVPRLLLFRHRRGRYVPKEQLQDRFRQFERGKWLQLLRMSQDVCAKSQSRSFRSRRREREDEARAARALSLVHMGELSAARQALEGAPMAPGTHATLRALTDPERPAFPREPLSAEVAHMQPAVPFQLDTDLFLVNLRKSRKGAAPGPSGIALGPPLPVAGETTRLRTVGTSGKSNGSRQCPGGRFRHHQTGSSHSTSEARQWHQGDCRGRRFEEVGDDREASVEEGRSGHCSLPIRTFDQSRM